MKKEKLIEEIQQATANCARRKETHLKKSNLQYRSKNCMLERDINDAMKEETLSTLLSEMTSEVE